MIFIQKGDAPMTYRQAVKRGLRYFEAQKAQWQREQGIVESDPDYLAWAAQWVADNLVNAENNQFNGALAKYRAAILRLSQYEVSKGRPEITEDQPTGEFDDDGNEILATVVIQTAIDPVQATIDQPVYDEDGNQTGTETVPNPLIVQDEAERVAAQAVIDATPDEVKSFYSLHLHLAAEPVAE